MQSPSTHPPDFLLPSSSPSSSLKLAMPPTRSQLQDKSNKQDVSRPAAHNSTPRLSDPYTKAPPLRFSIKNRPQQGASGGSRISPDASVQGNSAGPSSVHAREGERSSPAFSVGQSSSADTAPSTTTALTSNGAAAQKKKGSLIGGIENPIIEQKHIDELKQQVRWLCWADTTCFD